MKGLIVQVGVRECVMDVKEHVMILVLDVLVAVAAVVKADALDAAVNAEEVADTPVAIVAQEDAEANVQDHVWLLAQIAVVMDVVAIVLPMLVKINVWYSSNAVEQIVYFI